MGLHGDDAFPYGIEPNRKTVDALLDYSVEQGLSSRRVQLEELFAPEALLHPADTPPSRQRAAF